MRVPATIRMIGALILLSTVLVSAGMAYGATSSPSALLTLSGSLPAFASQSGTITVLAEPDFSGAATAGQQFFFPVIATQQVSGSSFSVAIPNTAQVTADLTNVGGSVPNVLVELSSGGQATEQASPLPLQIAPSTKSLTLNASSGNSVVGPAPSGNFALPAFPASWSIASAPSSATALQSATPITNVTIRTQNGCYGTLIGKPVEQASRIGELHVATNAGMQATYTYDNTADSLLSVGLSVNGGATWSVGGSVGITNSISTSSYVTEYSSFIKYINSNIMYGEFNIPSSLFCLPTVVAQGYNAIGDVFPGTGTPPGNPFGSCHADPYGSPGAVVSPSGGYSTQRQQAWVYSLVTNLFGFTFSGSPGYSTTNTIAYQNHGTTTTYVCGEGLPAVAPILYNDGY